MDHGHFLTDSGSKIPLPKSKEDASLKVPQKPNLTASTIKKTNYLLQAESKPPTTSLARSRNGVAKSNPTISKPLARSKTNLSRAPVASSGVKTAGSAQAVKRHASVDDVGEATTAKVPRTGLIFFSSFNEVY